MENQTQNQEQNSNINVAGEDQELNYWSREFGIEKDELLAVVKQGGTFAAAVENYVKTMKFAM